MLKLLSGEILKKKTECLVVPVCEDAEIHDDPAIIGLTENARKIKEFKGKNGDSVVLYDPADSKSDRILFIGLGKLEKIDEETMRIFAGKSVKLLIKKELSEIILCAPCTEKLDLKDDVALGAIFEGAFLGNHIFDKYKKDKKEKPLKTVSVFTDSKIAKRQRLLPSRIETICKGTNLAREWVSMPPNDKRPDRFVRSMVKAAEKEDLSFSILDEKALKQNGMGAILAVGAGSRSKPRLLILDYNPFKNKKSPKKKKTVVLVGKGVTFDSGGINLKPSGSLDEMKMDMSGAASVAGTLITLARLKHKFRVVGVIPVVENMPSGDATRPGDIIKSYSGKTIEIGNTDAEGRLILIDAMAYANKMFKPDVMIDMATLTGACVVALGEKIAGVFSTDMELAKDIVASGEATAERCWAMPMPEDYRKLLKSEFADINNMSSNRWGGAITAALFLSEFVENTRWAHIDIAGPAYSKKAGDYCGAGGTGFGVRLLIDLLNRM
ncbi:MAG: leucyl aminopeptidase [Desulfobacteraceae bacterium]|nr:leucyl aminopeptidase [Desulfobacteraceae bacterium]MBC2755667.1 leucyl aminopeptidase [Desulfobacteraceae bacterium]